MPSHTKKSQLHPKSKAQSKKSKNTSSSLSPKKVKLHRQYGEEKALKNMFYSEEQVFRFLSALEIQMNLTISLKEKKLFMAELGPLELKERLKCMADFLEKNLSHQQQNHFFKYASQGVEGWQGPLYWPLQEVLSRREKFAPEDFQLMKSLTQLWSAEFAIRPHLERHGDRYFEMLTELKTSKNEHHRRWMSEGSRPLLPWGQKVRWIHQNYKKIWEHVETLREDESLYVRKSVANHLNDLTKLDAEFAIQSVSRWKQSENELWIMRHGLRTLTKNGNQKALKLMGLGKDSSVSCSLFELKKKNINLGEAVEVIAQIQNKSRVEKHIQVDLVFEFLKMQGRASEKVFRGARLELGPQEILDWKKKVPIKPITTRSYVQGRQRVALRINGETTPFLEFELKIKGSLGS